MQQILDMMRGLGARVQELAEALGGTGLVLVAFIDSSFLTLPEVADVLIVLFTIRSPDDWLYFAAMTTLGSVAGSYALYLIGRRGGEALLRRRFHERHIDRGLAWFRRFGTLMLIIPATLPPPMPFKIFVLLAGVAGVERGRFVLAVAVGRGARYAGEALLAKLYGESALRFVQQNTMGVLLPAAAFLVTVAAVWLAWRRWIRRHPQPAEPAAPADIE